MCQVSYGNSFGKLRRLEIHAVCLCFRIFANATPRRSQTSKISSQTTSTSSGTETITVSIIPTTLSSSSSLPIPTYGPPPVSSEGSSSSLEGPITTGSSSASSGFITTTSATNTPYYRLPSNYNPPSKKYEADDASQGSWFSNWFGGGGH